MRCIVRVAVGTQPIRALFAGEKPPVADTEWDEAAYAAQRLRAYAEALENLALVRPMTSDGGDAASASGTSFSCPRTGDCVRVEPDDRDDGARGDAYADIERALQRVFADADAWRRHLLPAYVERHRNWRAVVGAPIQH